MKQGVTQIFSSLTSAERRSGPRKRRKKTTYAFQKVFDATLAWLRSRRLAAPTRKLRLCESVSLGEKRFAAVLEYEDQRFLVGGAAQSVQLLTELGHSTFSRTLAAKRKAGAEAH